jgi:hypothetical protein
MDGDIDLAQLLRPVELLGEQALAAGILQRLVEDLVAGRGEGGAGWWPPIRPKLWRSAPRTGSPAPAPAASARVPILTVRVDVICLGLSFAGGVQARPQ